MFACAATPIHRTSLLHASVERLYDAHTYTHTHTHTQNTCSTYVHAQPCNFPHTHTHIRASVSTGIRFPLVTLALLRFHCMRWHRILLVFRYVSAGRQAFLLVIVVVIRVSGNKMRKYGLYLYLHAYVYMYIYMHVRV